MMADQLDKDPHLLAILELTQAGVTAHKRFRLRVNGMSMTPALHMGDVLVAEHVPTNELRRGDILVVRRSHDLVTHRLIVVTAETWQTKGDRSWQADPEITAPMILGRVTAIERGRRRIDLQRGRWPMVNRILGRVGAYESRLRGGKIGGALAGNSAWLVRWMNRITGLPFRLLNILLTI